MFFSDKRDMPGKFGRRISGASYLPGIVRVRKFVLCMSYKRRHVINASSFCQECCRGRKSE